MYDHLIRCASVCLFSKTEVLSNIWWYLDANFLTDCLFLIVKTVTPGQYLIHFVIYVPGFKIFRTAMLNMRYDYGIILLQRRLNIQRKNTRRN